MAPRALATLSARASDTAGVVVVAHPDGRAFPLYDWEWALAQRMDGSRDLAALIAEAKRLGVPADMAGMAKVVGQLQRYGFLEPVLPTAPLPDIDVDDEKTAVGPTSLALLKESSPPEPVVPDPASPPSEDGASDEDPGDADASTPESPEDAWSAAASTQQRAKRRKQVLWASAGALLLLSAVVRYPLRITEPVEFRPATRSEVRATGDGVITHINKKEGEAVEAGEAIAELDSTDVRAHVDELAARESELTAELDKLRKGNRPEEIARAEQAVSGRRVAYSFAKSKLARQQQLFNAKVASQDDRDAARFDMEIKRKELYNAEADLNLVRAGARSEDIKAKEAEVARAQAESRFAKAELARKQVRSPIAGLLVTPHYDESLGRAVKQGDLVADVAQLDRMRAEILLPQAEMGEVKLGQPVTLKVESYPGTSFHGTVAFIPATASDSDDHTDKILRVTAYVDNTDLLLRDKMSGWGEIDTGPRSLLGILFRRTIRWFRVRFLV